MSLFLADSKKVCLLCVHVLMRLVCVFEFFRFIFGLEVLKVVFGGSRCICICGVVFGVLCGIFFGRFCVL